MEQSLSEAMVPSIGPEPRRAGKRGNQQSVGRVDGRDPAEIPIEQVCGVPEASSDLARKGGDCSP